MRDKANDCSDSTETRSDDGRAPVVADRPEPFMKHFTWDYEATGTYHVYTTEGYGFTPDWVVALYIEAPKTKCNDEAVEQLVRVLDMMADQILDLT